MSRSKHEWGLSSDNFGNLEMRGPSGGNPRIDAGGAATARRAELAGQCGSGTEPCEPVVLWLSRGRTEDRWNFFSRLRGDRKTAVNDRALAEGISPDESPQHAKFHHSAR